MADNRKKASMSQVLADIKPYITKKFMAVPCIKEQDIQAIAGYTDGGVPYGVMWEEVGIDPGLPFEEKVKLYHMQMLGLYSGLDFMS